MRYDLRCPSALKFRIAETPMTKNAVLFVNSNYAHVLIELENLFTVFNYRDAKDKEQLLRAAAPVVRAVFTNESSWVPEIMDALPKLEMIALVSNGHERFDLKKARARNIRISNTPTETTGDVADLAVTLMLATARKITWAERYVRSGEWLAKGRPPLTRRFHRKQLGIIGLGSIGLAVAKRASGFDMEISYHGPNKKNVNYTYYADLVEMARNVDFLAVTCMGGPKTAGIVNAEVLAALGADGIVVNIARGTCIVEADLLQALRNGTIGGAGLDVYASEPTDPAPFAGLDNVVLTPHFGSGTPDTRLEMNATGIKNLVAFFSGQPLLTPVPL